MKHALIMAWRSAAHHRVKSAILVGAIALIVFIPSALRVLVHQGQAQLTARAEATPLLLGARDSPLELTLSALYFSGDAPEPIPFARVGEVAASGRADAIPLVVRFRAQDDPIVGTSIDYFDARGLRVADGRMLARLGECVLGAQVARARGLGPGDAIVSSPEAVFDLAGVYPLKMRVAGVLAPSGGPDDHAIFVDVKTTWVMAGLLHGHGDLAPSEVLAHEDGAVVANATVREYQEITAENAHEFHLHGEAGALPITAVLVVPADAKSSALLLGRYQSDERAQLIRPIAVVDDLLATVFSVQNVVVAALALVAAATLALAALVFLLSLRLRRAEIDTMIRIGGARSRIALILGFEIAGVLAGGILIAAVLTALTSLVGPEAIGAMLRH